MASFDRYKADIEKLLARGRLLYAAMCLELNPDQAKRLGKDKTDKIPNIRDAYQPWYSEALSCLSQLLPDRVDDFISYYKPLKSRKDLTAESYTVSDYLRGLAASRGETKIVGPDAALNPLKQQIEIVEAIKNRFESTLFDIKALVQADLFDDELDTALELKQKGFQRAAGAISGVVLEGHLETVLLNHKLTIPRNPTIAKMNDLLKEKNILEQATWRFIQHLGDIRNKCDHQRGAEPQAEEIEELISGIRKITKVVF